MRSQAALALLAFGFASASDAGPLTGGVRMATDPILLTATHRADRKRRLPARDCTPLNGRFGYYGNPWCEHAYYGDEDPSFYRERYRTKKK